MVINQPFAIGDLLFLEPMFRYYWKKNGEKPTVPVSDHLIWIKEYIESANFIPRSLSPRWDLDSMNHSDDFLNMRYANQILRGYGPHDHHDFENMMLDKYRLVGLPEDMWTQIKITFDQRKAEKLYVELVKYTEEYDLINNHSQAGVLDINLNKSNRPFFTMKTVPGYSVIDWFLVMMCAKENHHVSTSTFYLMQAIKNKFPEFDSKIFMYPRPNVDGLRGISQLKPTFEYYRVKS